MVERIGIFKDNPNSLAWMKAWVKCSYNPALWKEGKIYAMQLM